MDVTSGAGEHGATGRLLVTFPVEGEWGPGPVPQSILGTAGGR